MDLSTLLAKLWEVSPILAVCSIIVWALWDSNKKKDQTVLDTVKAHAEDRKETQTQILAIVTQNSSASLQLSNAVEKLTDSNKDVVNRLISVEKTVDKSSRTPRTTTAATAKA